MLLHITEISCLQHQYIDEVQGRDCKCTVGEGESKS